MALNINGTTGISGVDGSASAASISGTDANSGLSFASDTVNINTGGTTRATINSSGSFGLGTSSPATIFHISQNNPEIRIQGTLGNGSTHKIFSAGLNAESLQITAASNLFTNSDTHFLRNSDESVEYARLTSNGVLLIDSTSEYSDNQIGRGKFQIDARQANRNGITIRAKNSGGSAFTSSNVCAIGFVNSNGVVGQITISGSSTSFLTSSDYRLKENATAISDGITRLKTLKPYRFNFIAEPDKTVDGFFAHEVTAVPEAINGVKDEVTTSYYQEGDTIPEGKAVGDVKSTTEPVYQGIDQSKLVPLLTAALQEAVGKIEVLETKVAALEAA